MKNFIAGILLCITLLLSGQAHAADLVSGSVTNGSLAINGSDTYTFSGTAGQGFYMTATASYNVVMTFYKPGMVAWTTGTNGFQSSLPSTGQYTVVVTAQHPATQSGAYALDYVRGDDSVSQGALTSGTTAAATLATNGLQSFTFSGTIHQSIALYLTAAWSGGANLWIYKPDGSLWTQVANSYTTSSAGTELPATGTYTVIVTGFTYSSTGSFNLSWVLGGGGSTVSNGKLISGTWGSDPITTNGVKSYQFDATSGQGIELRIGSSIVANLWLYAPDGTYVTNAGDAITQTSLSQTGTYTVVVTGQTYSTTGAYNLYYVRGDDTVSEGWLLNGKTRPGSQPLGGLMSYKFEATSGNSLSITSTAAWARNLYVYKPNGSYWSNSANSFSGTIPTSGEYTVVLSSGLLANDGAYTITVTTTQSGPGGSGQGGGCCCAGGFASAGGIAGGGFSGGAGGSPGPGNGPAAPGGAPAHVSGNGNISSTGNTMLSSNFNVNGPQLFTGNPINFDVGYKTQTETDYQAGGLNFTRVYRSDSTWTSNTIGTLWRHN